MPIPSTNTLDGIAGKPVLSDYRIPGVALDVFRDRAQGLFERMREAYSARDLQRRPTAALFPPTYPDFDETCS